MNNYKKETLSCSVLCVEHFFGEQYKNTGKFDVRGENCW